jgi:hypothetical protein
MVIHDGTGWLGAGRKYYASAEGAQQSFAEAFHWKSASPEKLAEVRALPSKRGLLVFLCHAQEDKPRVRELHVWLKTIGFEPWLDELELLPGERWPQRIPRQIRNSEAFLACLSKTSTTKTGYVQKEFKLALDFFEHMPEGRIFFIPVCLEPCDLPDSIRDLHACRLYNPEGNELLLRALNAVADQIDPDGQKIVRGRRVEPTPYQQQKAPTSAGPRGPTGGQGH